MWSCHEALAFGRRGVTLNVLRLGWNPRASSPGLESVDAARSASSRSTQARAATDAAAASMPAGPTGAARVAAADPLPGSHRAEAMDQLLEKTFQAEREHFWFKGFRQFITPMIERALEGVAVAAGARLRLRHRHQHGAAGGRTPTSSASTSRASASTTRARQGRQRVARASITHMPFRSEAFDLATSFDVLVCLDEAQETRAMRELARVLKPGGEPDPERRRARAAARQPLRVRGGSPALHPADAPVRARARRPARRAHDLHELLALPR